MDFLAYLKMPTSIHIGNGLYFEGIVLSRNNKSKIKLKNFNFFTSNQFVIFSVAQVRGTLQKLYTIK